MKKTILIVSFVSVLCAWAVGLNGLAFGQVGNTPPPHNGSTTGSMSASEEIIYAVKKSDREAIHKMINDDPDLLKQKLIEIPNKEYQPTLLH
ncbi:MAG: hypothetical protein LBJ67_08925, partial [Planctomycetaceae bacterium]|nr:hypothetical protein [Planctomycetaceae bacterium]